MTKKNKEIDLGKKQHQIDWDEFMKVHKEEEKNKGVCPNCGRCPTCGKILWPTPHGPEPCHPYTPNEWWWAGRDKVWC